MVDPADDLRRAAIAVMSGGSAQSLNVRTSVAEMLQWMAETNVTGSEFGQGVAERARAIGVAPHGQTVADSPVDPSENDELSEGPRSGKVMSEVPRGRGRL